MSGPQSSSRNILADLSQALADAVERAAEATVLVNARRRLPASGIVYAADRILTADHIIEREEDISVVLPDGSEVSASLVGRDPRSDLALLRLDRAASTIAQHAAQEARIGQMVLALGRPTRAGIEASLGIVSAAGGPVRTGRGGLIERYLRTDAIPYPGFSGGPLIDSDGAVVGINTSGLAMGTMLCIPMAQAKKIADALAQHGRIKRGYLGIRSQPSELPTAQQQALGRQQRAGLLVIWVEDGGPAAQGGLIVGDILVAIGGRPVEHPDDLQSELVGAIVGQQVAVEVLRGGQPQTLTVTVGERR